MARIIERNTRPPAEEARFITLWNTGTEQAEISRQLGIPRGTVSSRASTLARQGKIQPRPKGGAYPRRTAQGQQEDSPAPARVDIEPWTVRLSKALIERMKAEADATHTNRVTILYTPARNEADCIGSP
jgi:Winged helix-turn-helix DNA-binding